MTATCSPFFTPALQRFSVQNDVLLYAKVPRESVQNLKTLLSRGSGHVVRGGKRSKRWFEAQCAHYRLPTTGTVAALRLILTNFLETVKTGAEQDEKSRQALERELCTLVATMQKEGLAAVRVPGSKSTQPQAGSTSFVESRTLHKDSISYPALATPQLSAPVLHPTSSKTEEPSLQEPVSLPIAPIVSVSCPKSYCRSMRPQAPVQSTCDANDRLAVQGGYSFLVPTSQARCLAPNVPHILALPDYLRPTKDWELGTSLKMALALQRRVRGDRRLVHNRGYIPRQRTW